MSLYELFYSFKFRGPLDALIEPLIKVNIEFNAAFKEYLR